MPSEWVILLGVIATVVFWMCAKPPLMQRMHERKHGKELPEPLSAEVLYRGEAIADLTDRKITEMFWLEYQIEPKTSEARAIIGDDDLWDASVFEYRDPKTGGICTSGFVGGTRPFIKDGRISLRGLYFGGKAGKSNTQNRPCQATGDNVSRSIQAPSAGASTLLPIDAA